MSEPNRRAVLQGAAVAAVSGVAGFVAFSLRDEEAADPAYAEDEAASSGGQGTVLASVDDIPDGGGVIVQDANVVVTRDGSSIQAFSAVCTHQGCTVASVQDGRISCACHGSVFDSGTGAVLQGPAQRPLAPVEVGLVDGSIVTV
jgi:Rieske Fe-S protein